MNLGICPEIQGFGLWCEVCMLIAHERVCMHPVAMEMVALLVRSLYRFSSCTKMAVVAVAKLLLY